MRHMSGYVWMFEMPSVNVIVALYSLCTDNNYKVPTRPKLEMVCEADTDLILMLCTGSDNKG